MKRFVVLLTACLVTGWWGLCVGETDIDAEVRKLTKNKPKDVVTFIYRSVECRRLSNVQTETVQETLAREDAQYRSGCSTLADDEAQLRKKYRGNTWVLGTLDKARELLR